MTSEPAVIVDALSREFAFRLSRSGTVTWADARAARLVGLTQGAALRDQVAASDQAKADTFVGDACERPIAGRELTFLLDGRPGTVLLLSELLDGEAVVIGSLVPEDYQAMLEPLHTTLSQLTVLQREAQRQGRELERQRLALEVSEREASRLAEENQRARGQAEFLAAASRELHASLDGHDVAAVAARRGSPALAPVCGVVQLGPSGTVDQAWVSGASGDLDPAAATQLTEAMRASHFVLRWLTSSGGQSSESAILIDESTGQAREFAGWLRSVGQRYAVVLPVHTLAAPRGALVIADRVEPVPLSGDRFALAESFARYLGGALDNAWLYREANLVAQMRADFIAIASHELRGPLTSLLGFSSVLSRRARGDEGLAAARDKLVLIHESAERMRRTLDLFLSLTRFDGAAVPVHREETAVFELIEGEARAARSRYPQVAIQVAPAAEIVVDTDPDITREILANLLDNAAKYAGEGVIEVGAASSRGVVTVYVRDEGPGIAAEDLAHIFDRYYRGQARPATVQGTGLGLYSCRQMARLVGAELTVESEPGSGSTFTLVLRQ